MTRAQDDCDVPPSAALSLDLASRPSTLPLRLISHNVRYATPNPVPGEAPWSVRCPRLTAQLEFTTAGQESAFICLQECLYSQVCDIQRQLGDLWAYVGRGRGEGPLDGEFSPIFYRRAAWRCERHETRWLSETPGVPSRGWDARHNRIVTVGEFSHVGRGTRVVVMSTHLDHAGPEARRQSARLLLQIAREWKLGTSPSPSVLLIGGDFNSRPDDGAYAVMTAPGSGMADVADLVPESRRHGNSVTYSSFGEPGEAPLRIDFLFIQEPRTAHVNTYGVLANSFDDGVLLSDHRPVVADFDILV